MKNYILRLLLTAFIAVAALPTMAQDYMKIFLKDGTTRKFYLQGVTEISTSQYDAYGVKHSDYSFQHVTTNNKDYVYNLSDIDSIAFSKFDEVKTRQDFTSAMTTTVQALSDCETIDDAQQTLDQIKTAEGVENAWIDGHELFVKINKWDAISFHFNHSNDDEAEEEIETSVRNIRTMTPQLAHLLRKDGRCPKVVIANQLHYDERPSHKNQITKYFKPLLEDFKACGFDPDPITGSKYLDKPTVSFFTSEMYQFDVVFLITHGGFKNSQHYFYSGEVLYMVPKKFKNNDNPKQYSLQLYNSLIEAKKNTIYENVGDDMINCNFIHEIRSNWPYWVGHPYYYESFFGKNGLSQGKFPQGAIFFNAACLTMKGEENNPELWHSLADSLIQNHNLSLYFGYDEENYRGEKAGYFLFSSMLQGKSVGQAFDGLDPIYKEEADSQYDAYLKRWPEIDKDNLFLWPTYTTQKSEETANSEYRLINSVEVEGWTTCLHEDQTPETIKKNITMGFEYNLAEDFSGEGGFTNEVTVLPLFTSSEKGNVVFKANLTDLKLGNTYYYRAYTFDDLFYNYGDTCSFTLYSDLCLSTTKLESEVGITQNVEITSGSGSYDVEVTKSSKEGVITASVNEGVIEITALKAGSATITVTDAMTGQTVTIEVTVQPVSPWTDIIINGDLTSDDMRCFYNRIYPATVSTLSTVTNGAIKIHSPAKVNEGWDTQFWVRLPQTVPDGTKFKFRFEAKASANTRVDMEFHNEPGTYLAWNPIGDISVDNAWHTYTFEEQVPSECEGRFRSIAFDLAKDDDIIYYFRNFKFEIPTEAVTEFDFPENIEYKPCPDENHPHMIDLGLPSGTKWACCNVGASAPEGYGEYFAWGETKPKKVYSLNTYQYYHDETWDDLGSDIAGTIYDAATSNWQAPWQMPTLDQCNELLDNCSSVWTQLNGVNGRVFIGPNGGNIFLPASGCRNVRTIDSKGTYGFYWSSTVCETGFPRYMYDLGFDASDANMYDYDERGDRTHGHSVRPVCKE